MGNMSLGSTDSLCLLLRKDFTITLLLLCIVFLVWRSFLSKALGDIIYEAWSEEIGCFALIACSSIECLLGMTGRILGLLKEENLYLEYFLSVRRALFAKYPLLEFGGDSENSGSFTKSGEGSY